MTLRLSCMLALAAAALGAQPAAAAPSRIVFMCGPNTMDVCSARSTGSGIRQLTRGDPAVGGTFGQLTQGGSRVAYIHRDRTIRVIDLSGRQRLSITTPLRNPGTVELDRRGRSLLFTDHSELFPRRVCRSRLAARSARCFDSGRNYQAWGPRGSVMSTEEVERSDICVERPANRCGRRLARVPLESSFFQTPALSPNGRWIAAIEELRGKKRVVIFDVRSGRRRRTLTGGHQDGNPTWSPDGRWIAFDRDARIEAPRPNTQIVVASIWRVRSSGGRPRRIIDRGYQPAWAR